MRVILFLDKKAAHHGILSLLRRFSYCGEKNIPKREVNAIHAGYIIEKKIQPKIPLNYMYRHTGRTNAGTCMSHLEIPEKKKKERKKREEKRRKEKKERRKRSKRGKG